MSWYQHWDAFWWEWISISAEPWTHFSFTCRGTVHLIPCRIRICTGLRSIARGFVHWIFFGWALLSFSLSMARVMLCHQSHPGTASSSSGVCRERQDSTAPGSICAGRLCNSPGMALLSGGTVHLPSTKAPHSAPYAQLQAGVAAGSSRATLT